MDSTEWPWSWEEEAAWKAELEERKGDDFLAELIDSAFEEDVTGWRDVLRPRPEEAVEDAAPEKYSVTT